MHITKQKHIFYNIEIKLSIVFFVNWFYCNLSITCFRKLIKSKTYFVPISFINLSPFGRMYHWWYKSNFDYFCKILTFLYIFWSMSPMAFHLNQKTIFSERFQKLAQKRLISFLKWKEALFSVLVINLMSKLIKTNT